MLKLVSEVLISTMGVTTRCTEERQNMVGQSALKRSSNNEVSHVQATEGSMLQETYHALHRELRVAMWTSARGRSSCSIDVSSPSSRICAILSFTSCMDGVARPNFFEDMLEGVGRTIEAVESKP